MWGAEQTRETRLKGLTLQCPVNSDPCRGVSDKQDVSGQLSPENKSEGTVIGLV